MPDNLCVSRGGNLLLCEDGDGTDKLCGLTLDGELFEFGRNIISNSEFAGATFSPDGKFLFVNSQGSSVSDQGMTFVIWGPWENGPLA
jgi:hypothetical protein